MIKECLVINCNNESIFFTDFTDSFTEEEFIEIATYYFKNKNIDNCYFFGNIGFNDKLCVYVNNDDDFRYLVDNGDIDYRLNYEDIKKVYENRSGVIYLHKTYCEDCMENLFLYTEKIDTSCECWSCDHEYKLNKDTIIKAIK